MVAFLTRWLDQEGAEVAPEAGREALADAAYWFRGEQPPRDAEAYWSYVKSTLRAAEYLNWPSGKTTTTKPLAGGKDTSAWLPWLIGVVCFCCVIASCFFFFLKIQARRPAFGNTFPRNESELQHMPSIEIRD